MRTSPRTLTIGIVASLLTGFVLATGPGTAAAVTVLSARTSAPPVAEGAEEPVDLPVSYRRFLDDVGGSRYLTVDGVRMHYVEAGDADKPVLLLLHGSPDSVYSWRAIMPELARHYRVIAPDLVGFGRSAQPDGPLTWSVEIDYLTAFVEAKKLRDVTLVATDIGGLFGFAYAAEHRGNVVAIATWETVTAPIASYDLLGGYCPQCVGFFQVPKDPALRQQFLVDNPDLATQVYGGAGLLRPLTGDELAGYAYFLSTPQQRTNVADIGANMPIGGDRADNVEIATDFARYLRTSDVPKLVLYSEPGAILPAATATGLGTPNTTYASVGPGYHFLVEDAPAAITDTLLRWRADLPGRTGR